MTDRNHKPCCGTMFHDVLHFQENAPINGKVFAFELDRTGLTRSDRAITADIGE